MTSTHWIFPFSAQTRPDLEPDIHPATKCTEGAEAAGEPAELLEPRRRAVVHHARDGISDWCVAHSDQQVDLPEEREIVLFLCSGVQVRSEPGITLAGTVLRGHTSIRGEPAQTTGVCSRPPRCQRRLLLGSPGPQTMPIGAHSTSRRQLSPSLRLHRENRSRDGHEAC